MAVLTFVGGNDCVCFVMRLHQPYGGKTQSQSIPNGNWVRPWYSTLFAVTEYPQSLYVLFSLDTGPFNPYPAGIFHWRMMTSSNGTIFRVTGPLCGEVSGEFPSQWPVTRSFDVFFDLRLNRSLCKQSSGWWFETTSGSLWRRCNAAE